MQQHGISKLDLKRQNRMQVLKILKQRGPTSRIDIANMLELTRAAVTIITNEMISQGIIAEVGEYQYVDEKAPRGRKKILIDINQNYKFVLGVLIDEGLISVGLSTLVGAVLDKRNLEINDEVGYDEILKFIKKSMKAILLDNCLKLDDILGIGFGVFPGVYDAAGVEIGENGEPNFTNLAVDIYKEFPVPLIFDNSVKGMAMAHIDFQPDKDVNRHNIAFLRYGKSLHFVVTNLNDPIISYDNRTDFVDKIIINPYAESNNDNGMPGSARAEISRTAVINKVKNIYSRENTPYLYELTNGDINNISFDAMRSAVDKGDKNVNEVYRTSIKLFAVLLNNLYYSTNPQRLVIHNLNISENVMRDIKDELNVLGAEQVSPLIDISIIEKKHGFLSGAAIAIRELFFTRGGFDTEEENV